MIDKRRRICDNGYSEIKRLDTAFADEHGVFIPWHNRIVSTQSVGYMGSNHGQPCDLQTVSSLHVSGALRVQEQNYGYQRRT
jgi:hypothetical protein